jgi:microcystin-dependent protein
MTRVASYLAGAILGLAALATHADARAQSSDFYIGQLQQFGTSWCPQGWARADGSLISISQNTALFSLLGTRFGGNGTTTFALPDLRDRAPVGMSNNLPLGSATGSSQHTIQLSQLPRHEHDFHADPTGPVSNSPADSMMGLFPAGRPIYAGPASSPNMPMNPGMVATAGGSMPVTTQMPILATNWCIAMSGIYPSRP